MQGTGSTAARQVNRYEVSTTIRSLGSAVPLAVPETPRARWAEVQQQHSALETRCRSMWRRQKLRVDRVTAGSLQACWLMLVPSGEVPAGAGLRLRIPVGIRLVLTRSTPPRRRVAVQ